MANEVDLRSLDFLADTAPLKIEKRSGVAPTKEDIETGQDPLSFLGDTEVGSTRGDFKDFSANEDGFIKTMSNKLLEAAKANPEVANKIKSNLKGVSDDIKFMFKMATDPGGAPGTLMFDAPGEGQVEAGTRSIVTNLVGMPMGILSAFVGAEYMGMKSIASLFGLAETGDINDAMWMMDKLNSVAPGIMLKNEEQFKMFEAMGKPFEWASKVIGIGVDNVQKELQKREVIGKQDIRENWVLGATLQSVGEGLLYLLGPAKAAKGVKGISKKVKASKWATTRRRLKDGKEWLRKERLNETGFKALENKTKALEKKRALESELDRPNRMRELTEAEAQIANAERDAFTKKSFLEKRVDALIEVMDKAKKPGDVRKIFAKHIGPEEFDHIVNNASKLRRSLRKEVSESSAADKAFTEAGIEVERTAASVIDTIADRPVNNIELARIKKSAGTAPRFDIPVAENVAAFKRVHHEMKIDTAINKADRYMNSRDMRKPFEIGSQDKANLANAMQEYDHWYSVAQDLMQKRGEVGNVQKHLSKQTKKQMKKEYKDKEFGEIDANFDNILETGKPAPRQGTRISATEKLRRKNLKRTFKDIDVGLGPRSVQGFLEAMTANNASTPGKLVPTATTAGESVTLNMLGSQSAYEAAIGRINTLRQISMERGYTIMDWLSLEAPYRRVGAPNVGMSLKNMPSIVAAYEERGLHWGRKLAKRIRKKGTEKHKLDIVLSAENKEYFNKLPKDVQEKIKSEVKYVRDFFDSARKQYKKWGIKADWKQRVTQDIETLMKEEGLTLTERESLAASLKKMETMEFVHIPVFYLETLMEGSRQGLTSLNPFVLQVMKRRRAFSIDNLVKEMGDDFANQVDPSEIMASYMRRMGKDAAVVKLIKAAEKDGMIKISQKGKQPKLSPEMKRTFKNSEELQRTIETIKKGEDIPENFVKLDPRVFNFIEGDKYVHSMLNESIKSLMKFSDEANGAWAKVASQVKMLQFFNPLIMPMFDIVQAAFHMGPDLLIPGRSKRVRAAIRQGFRDAVQKNDNYFQAQLDGMASTPFNNPFKTWQRSLRAMTKSYPELLMDTAKRVPRSYGASLVRDAYNLSWKLAWEFDRGIRTMSYNYLKSMGLDSKQAAQMAALYHGDYASVPAGTRRILNKLFFTPTFKIAMGKLYYRMVKDTIKSVTKFGRVNRTTKAGAKGVIGLLGVNLLVDQAMVNSGFEREEFGRKYVVKDQIDDETGELKDLVVTFANPANLTQKYVSRFMKSLDVGPDQSSIVEFAKLNKYDLTPTMTIFYDAMVKNEDMNGDLIAKPFDTPFKQNLDRLQFMAKNVFKISSLLEKQEKNPARKAFAKKFGTVAELFTEAIAFKYMRSSKDRQKLNRVRRLQSLWKRYTKRLALEGEDPSNAEIERYMDLIDKVYQDMD